MLFEEILYIWAAVLLLASFSSEYWKSYLLAIVANCSRFVSQTSILLFCLLQHSVTKNRFPRLAMLFTANSYSAYVRLCLPLFSWQEWKYLSIFVVLLFQNGKDSWRIIIYKMIFILCRVPLVSILFFLMMHRFLGILLSQMAWKTVHIAAVNGETISPVEHGPGPF